MTNDAAPLPPPLAERRSTAAAAEPHRPRLPPPAAVDVVLPCLDEAEGLAWLLPRMPAGTRAVVVDNGSTDGSADVARAHGATVVRAERKGFGAAAHAGLEAATADVVAFMDADASLDPADLPLVLDPVLAGDAELVLGRRDARRGAWPWHLRFANHELARRTRRRTGVPLHDLGPMRAARRDALLGLDLRDRRSGYPLEMVVAAADAGWRVAEVDVPYVQRKGRSKVTGTPLGAWRAVSDMSKVLAR
ncbi:glycosyltransferase family 2 protein [Cellulomonas sp. PhB143]|uniref:glycosyltransferase family 2 protein n=1 Tax=Cellulomonas sp. PhB143 TaxID=2485186 RepID=UPI000FBED0E1|nr:glycosyl transferase family 2 [Cellulomonas sp. PhB143]